MEEWTSFYRSLYKSKSTLNMKKTFLFLYTLLVFSGVYAQENKVKVEPVNGDKISLFSLKEVRLLDSDFKHIMDLNHAYMLSLEPDRLLSWFRREARHNPILFGNLSI